MLQCVCVCVGGGGGRGNPEFIPNELAIFLWAIARYTGSFTLPLRKKGNMYLSKSP